MNEIVFCGDNGQLITTSLKVAEVFGKEHNKVVRDIENLSCSDNFRVANFGDTPYVNPQNGQTYKIYSMTKDGFVFLVMGYRGAKATQFKEAYINAFNKMEQSIRSTRDLPSSADTAMLKQLVETTQTMAAQISRMQEELNRQRDMLLLPPANVIVEEPRISPRQRKYYTVKQIAKEFDVDPRLLNNFFEYMEIQEYDHNKQRWVLNESLVGLGYTYTVVYEPIGPYEELREYMVWTPKGKEYLKERIREEQRKYQENRRKENSL